MAYFAAVSTFPALLCEGVDPCLPLGAKRGFLLALGPNKSLGSWTQTSPLGPWPLGPLVQTFVITYLCPLACAQV